MNASDRCAYPWQQMIIDLTGEVVPCCFWAGYGNSGKPLGNTNANTIDEIWHGKGYRALRAKMASGNLDGHPCGSCMAYRWAHGSFPKFSWPAGFVQENGHCYLGQIPEEFIKATASSTEPIRLYENEIELPHPDALHDDIRREGKARSLRNKDRIAHLPSGEAVLGFDLPPKLEFAEPQFWELLADLPAQAILRTLSSALSSAREHP